MAKMTDADLRELAVRGRDASVEFAQSQQSRDRREAMQFYRGENLPLYGDSGAGLSTVVSRDTMEAVEAMLPSLCKPFVSGDQVVRYEPRGPEDEEPTKQATEYVNFRFTNDNNAFRVVYDSIKDGLLFRLGVGKVVRETVEEVRTEQYGGLDDAQLAAIDPKTIVGDVTLDASGYSVTVQRTEQRAVYRVYVIAPDEFLYEERLASLEDATFLGHRKTESVADLIAMGLPRDKVVKLNGVRADSDERSDRFRDEGWREIERDGDDLARKVEVCECYVLCDYDGTGVLSWRQVWLGGENADLIAHYPAEDHPFVCWTPIPLPHRLVGMSIADLTRDIQMQKTAVTRESLNALYLANRPQRAVLEGQANIEDLLNPSVGGIVRVKSAGAVQPLATGGEGVIAQSSAIIEYLDTVREARTGVTRYNQGMDANSLNKTATGVSIISNASQQRQELIARQYAECFLVGVFKKLLKLVCRHQDKADVIRLRGEWVEMNPQDWRPDYDMSVSVGLGTGDRDQMIGRITNLLQLDQQIVSLQGGIQGPLLTGENIYEKLKRLVEAMGLKGVERYYTDPGKAQEQVQEQPDATDPMEAERQKAAAEIEKAKIKAMADIEIAKIKAAADAQIEMMKAGMVFDAPVEEAAELPPEMVQ